MSEIKAHTVKCPYCDNLNDIDEIGADEEWFIDHCFKCKKFYKRLTTFDYTFKAEKIKKPTCDLLSLKMGRNHAGAFTISDYLKKIAYSVIENEDAFSGKRPFGYSGWTSEYCEAIVKGGFVKGVSNEFGNFDETTQAECKRLLLQAIDNL